MIMRIVTNAALAMKKHAAMDKAVAAVDWDIPTLVIMALTTMADMVKTDMAVVY